MRNDQRISAQQAKISQLEAHLDDLHEEREVVYQELIYQKMDDGLDIPYSILDKPPVNDVFELPTERGKVITKRVNDEKADVVAYLTKWEKKAILSKHYHSDCIEILIPISGRFTVQTNLRNATIAPGQSVVFEINERHLVTCHEKEGKAKVLFQKHPISDA